MDLNTCTWSFGHRLCKVSAHISALNVCVLQSTIVTLKKTFSISIGKNNPAALASGNMYQTKRSRSGSSCNEAQPGMARGFTWLMSVNAASEISHQTSESCRWKLQIPTYRLLHFKPAREKTSVSLLPVALRPPWELLSYVRYFEKRTKSTQGTESSISLFYPSE